MTWNAKVVWSEGMFLQPQHFQQQDRYFESILEGRVRPVAPYGWGFQSLEIDPAALAIGKLQILAAKGILPDGTPFDIPGIDPAPPPLDVDAELKDELVVLALPIRRPGTLDVEASSEDDSLSRYAALETETTDTALSGGRSALLQVGALRLRLLRERDAADVYSRLGVAHVVERRLDNSVLLQRSYMPPTLHVGSDPALGGFLRELHGLLHQRGEALASRLGQPGRGGVAEIAEFLLLQTINRFEPLVAHFLAHRLLHPERLFAACVQLAGDLATFSHSARRPPEFPEYRHDALRESFAPVIAELRRSLSMVIEQAAVPIELQERSYGVRVAVIADKELLRSASFVLAVNAQMPAETLRARFPTQTKIGPAERLRDLVNLQLPGLALHSMPVAPRQIPYHAGFSYFELERSGDLWKQLERSGGMAMHVAGEFPGLEMEMWAIRG
jgi:type VI secretion system protein ImpJ